MAWDVATDPEYQEQLDWVDEFVREEVEPLDHAFPHLQFVPLNEARRRVVDPLEQQARDRVLGFEFRSFLSHVADEAQRNEDELVDLLATHRAVPHIGARFPLDDVVGARAYVADGRAVGKVVLDVA